MQTHENHTLQDEHAASWFTIQVAIIIGSIITGACILIAGNPSSMIATKPSDSAQQAEKKPIVAPITKNDLIFGDENASVTIVEYSDIECPFCNQFHKTINEVLTQYNGKVKYVLRHFPLTNIHPNATIYAQAIECVYRDYGKEKAFTALNALFANQPLKAPQTGAPEILLGTFIGKEIQVSAEAITTCLANGTFAQKVASDTKSGVSAGVSGTPSAFIINKKGDIQTIAGAQPFAAVKLMLDSILK